MAKTRKNQAKEPIQKRSRDTVETLLQAATQILGTLGFDSTTTNRIAEKAGVSIGSLYQYFPNKEELAAAVMERYVRHHAQVFEKRLNECRDRPFSEAIVAVAHEMASVYLDNRALLRVLGKILPQRIPLILRVRREVIEVLAAELRRRVDEVAVDDPEMAAFMVVNAGMGVIQIALYEDAIGSARLGEELARLFIGYFGASIGSGPPRQLGARRGE